MRLARALLLVPLIALAGRASPEEPDELWVFIFPNGDRLHGSFERIRDGMIVFRLAVMADRIVRVPLRKVAHAEPVPVVGARYGEDEEEERRRRNGGDIVHLRDGTTILGRFLRVADGKLEVDVEAIGVVRIQGGDVKELMPNEDAVRAFYHSLTAELPETDRPLSRERFESLWANLASEDPQHAWLAFQALVRAGRAALPFIEERLREQPDDPAHVERLIAQLSDNDARRREEAQRKLVRLGQPIEKQLAAALKRAKSAEVRFRLGLILETLDLGQDTRSTDILRFYRATRVLEEMGTPEAIALLKRLARGSADTRTSRDARRVLHRLGIDVD